MNIPRDHRKAQALAFLWRAESASALQIGRAAVRGERWTNNRNSWKAMAAIGLDIGVQLCRDGIAQPTRNNLFELNQSLKRATGTGHDRAVASDN